jgi:hypothetical protein
MWFLPVNEIIELDSGMPVLQFGDESSLSVRIRAGSSFKRFLCFVLIDPRCFRLFLKMSSLNPGGTRAQG